jgi:hypothetical protein
MIRAGLTATAAHATIYVTPTGGVGFEYRLTTGGNTTSTTTTGLKAPTGCASSAAATRSPPTAHPMAPLGPRWAPRPSPCRPPTISTSKSAAITPAPFAPQLSTPSQSILDPAGRSSSMPNSFRAACCLPDGRGGCPTGIIPSYFESHRPLKSSNRRPELNENSQINEKVSSTTSLESKSQEGTRPCLK